MRKKYYKYGLAFAIPFLISVIICVANGVYPFGDKCILHVDMYHQYCPFFYEFLHKLQNGGSLMYTWNEGLGSDFVALYAYYLASPLNWLLILCPARFVIEFMTLTILIKIGLCGLCMFAFLQGHFGEAKGNPYAVFVFSTAYALSGFVAAYSWDIMWMDSVALAPLVILGLEWLVRKKRVALYYVTLTICILSNYYIAMMLCIFLVFYFILLFFESENGRFGAFLRFSFYSLLAGGSAAVLLIPEAIVLSYSGSSGIRFPKANEWYFSILSELSRGCTTAPAYTGGSHWPNLYAGAFSLVLLVLYLCNANISWKKKAPRICMVAFFLVSFANNYLDFFWHGLHFPDSLPGRQSFLYIFVVLVLGYTAIREWDGVSVTKIGLSGAVVIILLIAGALATDETVTDRFAFLITGLFVACYVILAILTKLGTQDLLKWVQMFSVLLAFAELVLHIAVTGFYITGRTAYLAKMEDYTILLNKIEKEETSRNPGSFYRVEDPQRMTKNDSALYGYSSATEFSSLMNINTSHFYQSLFMEGGKNFYCYNGSTPLTSAMLSVKYVLLDNNKEENALRRLVGTSGNQYVYENNYWLPLGYMMPELVADGWDNTDTSGIGNLNEFGKMLGAAENMLSPVSCAQEVCEGSTTIRPGQSGFYYAAYEKCSADTLNLETETGRKRRFSKTTHKYLLELGECGEDGSFTITNRKNESISFRVYRLNIEAVEAAYRTLSKQTMSLTHFSDTRVEGTIDVADAGRLILSIPSQQGWTLYVDDIPTEIDTWKETFISVPLNSGEHRIRLEYQTPGLLSGAKISGCCVVIFVFAFGIRRKKKLC